MNSWCLPIAGQVTCRSRVSASCGNQSRTSSAHSCSLFGGPPGVMPAASAGAMYFRSVLRSTPRLAAISFFDRPACQCIKISVTSITSNVLLAIGPPVLVPDGRKVAPSRWPGPPRHARHPHGELRDRGGELRDRHLLKRGELRERRQEQPDEQRKHQIIARVRVLARHKVTISSRCRGSASKHYVT